MNITKEFIPYTEALSLKELEFDEPCFGLYHNDKTFYPTQCKSHEQFHGQICSAPLRQQSFRFFREKYGLFYDNLNYIGNVWKFSTYSDKEEDYFQSAEYKTYEEAELDCLKKLIEIVQTH